MSLRKVKKQLQGLLMAMGDPVFAESMFGCVSINSNALGLLAGGALWESDGQDPVFHRGLNILKLTDTRQSKLSSRE